MSNSSRRPNFGSLLRLHHELTDLEHACRCLVQVPRKERGAWVKPGLADSARTLEAALLKSYRQLALDILGSLSGSSDDIASGRLLQAPVETVSEDEIDEALAYYDLPKGERSHSVDHARLAAVLTLLALWRRRHTAIAEEAVATLFDQGHAKALSETGQRSQMSGSVKSELREAVTGRYGADLDRLESGLKDGTRRAHGIAWIVQNAATVGIAAALLRRLMTVEQFRVEMFSESLTWRAWSDGYRLGAVDATKTALKDAGVTVTADLQVSDLDAATKAQLPAWVWSGPDDEKCCQSCLDAFDEGPLYALSLDDLPAPEDVCSFGRACRHWYSLQENL